MSGLRLFSVMWGLRLLFRIGWGRNRRKTQLTNLQQFYVGTFLQFKAHHASGPRHRPKGPTLHQGRQGHQHRRTTWR